MVPANQATTLGDPGEEDDLESADRIGQPIGEGDAPVADPGQDLDHQAEEEQQHDVGEQKDQLDEDDAGRGEPAIALLVVDRHLDGDGMLGGPLRRNGTWSGILVGVFRGRDRPAINRDPPNPRSLWA